MAIPVLYAVIFSAAWSNDFLIPALTAQIVTMCYQSVCGLATLRVPLVRIKRQGLCILALGALMVAYESMANLVWGVMPGGIWNQVGMVAIAVSCAALLAEEITFDVILRGIFFVSGIMVFACCVLSACTGGMDIRGEARPILPLGNVSYITNTFGVGVIAWVWHLISENKRGRDSGHFERLGCVMSCIALIVLAIGTGRRATLVTIVCAGLIAAFGHRSGFKKAVVVGLAVTALSVVAAVILALSVGYHPRAERLLMYQGAFEVWDGLPWWGGGDGVAAMTRATVAESSRHLTSSGLWFWHTHNEVLECLLVGGIPLVILFVAFWGMVISAAMQIEEKLQRQAVLICIVGLGIAAVTNNTLSTYIGRWWACVVVVLVIRSISAGSKIGATEGEHFRRVVEMRKGLSLIAILIVAWGISRHASAILAKPENNAASLHRAFSMAIDTESVDRLGCASVLKAESEGRWNEFASYSLAVRERLGPASQVVEALPRAQLRNNDKKGQLAAEVDLAQMEPFQARSYREINKLLTAMPELAPFVPQRVLARAKRTLEDGAKYQDVTNIDDAADIFILALTARESGGEPRKIYEMLERIAPKYGDVPQVCTSVFHLSWSTPGIAELWSSESISMCRKGFGTLQLSELEQIRSSDEMARAAILLGKWYPAMLKAVSDRRTPIIFAAPDEQQVMGHIFRILSAAGGGNK